MARASLVECSKGEAWAGQEEINVRYADALTAADNHVIIKNGVKEIAWAQGPRGDLHGQVELHRRRLLVAHPPVAVVEGRQVADVPRQGRRIRHVRHDAPLPCRAADHASDFTCFLAPNINSYKRFQAGTFAPTKAIWSMDNRTAGYRICGAGTQGHPHRVPGGRGGPEPVPGLCRQLAAGIAGIEGKLELEPEFKGDAYAGEEGTGNPDHAARGCRCPEEVEDAARSFRRRRGGSLCPRGRVGAVRV
jgi:glutamine synthetase